MHDLKDHVAVLATASVRPTKRPGAGSLRALARAGAWVAAVLLVGCGPREAVPTVAELQATTGPTRESWGVDFRIDDDGQRRVHVESAYMAEVEINPDSAYVLLQVAPGSLATERPDSLRQTIAYLFDEQGDSSAVIVADQLFVYDEDRRIDARGQVVVTTREGKRLETDFLIWMEHDGEIQAPDFFRLTTATEQIQGYDLEADERLDTYVMRRITGRVQL